MPDPTRFEDTVPGDEAFAKPIGDTHIRRVGDFHILREVGRGGMGIVYEAKQESLQRRVALKVLPDVHVSSPELLKRFQREAPAAARLHHTNIVPVFGFGEEDGVHYLVMQFIEGQGLDHFSLPHRNTATPDDALRQQSRSSVTAGLQTKTAHAFL